MHSKEWSVEYTSQWGEWFAGLDEAGQDAVATVVGLLERLGGEKTGARRWYAKHVPRADRLYDEHVEALRREGRL